MNKDEQFAKKLKAKIDRITQLGKLMGYDFSDHDATKFEPHLWPVFRDHEFGDVDEDLYNTAYLDHNHRTPHHWQYWVTFDDDGAMRIFDMPDRYVAEMVAGWAADLISEKKDPIDKLKEWYNDNANKMHLHPDTVKKVKSTIDELVVALKSLPDRMDEHEISNWQREHKMHADFAGSHKALSGIADIFGALNHARVTGGRMRIIIHVNKPAVAVTGNFDDRGLLGLFRPKVGSMIDDDLEIDLDLD